MISVQRINSHLNTSVDVTETTDKRTYSNQQISWLIKDNIISSGDGIKVVIELTDTNQNKTIAECDYYIFNSVGYIHWLSVEPDYQDQNLATILRTEVLEELFGTYSVDIVYSYPTTPKAISLVEKTGFKPDTTVTGAVNWYSLKNPA